METIKRAAALKIKSDNFQDMNKRKKRDSLENLNTFRRQMRMRGRPAPEKKNTKIICVGVDVDSHSYKLITRTLVRNRRQ